MTNTEKLNTAMDKYAVFGNPIAHSKSPLLQMAFAQQSQQDMHYDAQCVATDNFTNAADDFFNSGGKGLNVTVPFKLEAFEYADRLTERAKVAGAVNTLSKQDGTVIGDNTDGVGLVADIQDNLAWQISDKTVLILGAGGAVRGIIEPLLDCQPQEIVIANRTLVTAKELVSLFDQHNNINACGYDELIDRGFDIIINGTSASLHGNLPDIPATCLKKTSCCYDMMYSQQATVFMQWASTHGAAQTADGLGMLVCQGAESFYGWRNVKPNTETVIRKIRQSL